MPAPAASWCRRCCRPGFWSARKRGPETLALGLDPRVGAGLLPLHLAIRIELRDERPQIIDLGVLLDAGEGHLGAGNLRLRVLDVVLELGLVPGDAGVLVGVRIGIIRRRSGLASVQTVEFGADLVLGAFTDG